MIRLMIHALALAALFMLMITVIYLAAALGTWLVMGGPWIG